MELEDTDFANYVDDMIDLLQDDKEIKGRQESTEAVKKLHELKQEKFIITTTDETEVRRVAMDAIEEKEKNLEQRIVDATNEIGVKTDESEKQIKVKGLTIKDELAQKTVEIKDDLRKTELDSIGRLEKREKEINEALGMKEIESGKKIDQKEKESKENLRMTEVKLNQKLKHKELNIKKKMRVTEVNSKKRLKHEEKKIKKNLRVIELESKGRLDQKGKEIEKQLDRKQLAQIQIEARRNDNISKAAEDDVMKSSHCDTPLQPTYERMRADNEEADKLAKLEAQSTKPVSYKKKLTVIKALTRPRIEEDVFHLLNRTEQVMLVRLRSGHNKLNAHMHKIYRLAPSLTCLCGEEDQTAEHILQRYKRHDHKRAATWPIDTSMHQNLYGGIEYLRQTTSVI